MRYSEIPFEVKLLLDANQVLSDDSLRLEQINMEIKEVEQIDVRFMDTAALTLYHSGWIIRGRLKPSKEKWELTFKYRTNLPDNGNQKASLEQALQDAAAAGFDLSDSDYQKEIDWSGERQVLSLSYSVKLPIVRPDRAEIWRECIMEHAPEPLRIKQWEEVSFEGLVNQLDVLGPILSQKYEGNWQGLETDVESWSTDNTTLVEITVKAIGNEAAVNKREQLKRQLKEKKLITDQSFSKTHWALRRFISSAQQDPFSLLGAGGYNLYFRHAEPESIRSEQALLSAAGLEQARRTGRLLIERQVPIQLPVLASPINRAKQTAQIAFGEQQVQLEPRLIQAELPQLLESIPQAGKNQVFVAHHYTFDNQLKQELGYMNMVLVKPLGSGNGYRLEHIYDLLAESIVKYKVMVHSDEPVPIP